MSLQTIINAQIGNLKREVIKVDAFGEDVEFLELTGKLLEEWESYCVEYDAVRKRGVATAKQPFALRSVLVGMSLCEADGSRPFNNRDGYVKLSKLPSNVIDDLFDRAQKLNRLGRYFQETVGNSSEVPSDDS